jgi:hypothetical protein
MALATAVLRPEMFRVVIECADRPRAADATAAAADDGGRPRAAGDRKA